MNSGPNNAALPALTGESLDGLPHGVLPAALRERWRDESVGSVWLRPSDWYHPAVDAIAAAILSPTDTSIAAEELGRARGYDGVGIGETIDDLGALYRALGATEPPGARDPRAVRGLGRRPGRRARVRHRARPGVRPAHAPVPGDPARGDVPRRRDPDAARPHGRRRRPPPRARRRRRRRHRPVHARRTVRGGRRGDDDHLRRGPPDGDARRWRVRGAGADGRAARARRSRRCTPRSTAAASCSTSAP